MTESKNVKLIKSYLQAVAENDQALVNRMLHPEFKVIEPESLPFGGVHKGNEGRMKLM